MEQQVKVTPPLKCPNCFHEAFVYTRTGMFFGECYPCGLRTAMVHTIDQVHERWQQLSLPASVEAHSKIRSSLLTLKKKYS